MGRGVRITCMKEALVPWEYGMEVIGHKAYFVWQVSW
jgi:hypothetical protein